MVQAMVAFLGLWLLSGTSPYGKSLQSIFIWEVLSSTKRLTKTKDWSSVFSFLWPVLHSIDRNFWKKVII